MVHRYIRLYPLYALGLSIGAVSGLATLALGHGAFTLLSFGLALVSGILLLPSPTWSVAQDLVPLNFPAWSLLFELLANLLFVVAWRRLTNHILALIIAVSLAMVAVSFAKGVQFGGEAWPNALWGLPRIGFSFFLGVLLQRLHRSEKRQSHLAWAIVAAPALVMICTPLRGGMYVDFGMLLVGAPLIVWFGATYEPGRTEPFRWLGDISYPLYVLHIPVLSVIWRTILALHYTVRDFAPAVGFAYIATLLVASWWLDTRFDQPARRWLLAQYNARRQPRYRDTERQGSSRKR